MTATPATHGVAGQGSGPVSPAQWSDEQRIEALRTLKDQPLTVAYAVIDASGITSNILNQTTKRLGRKQVGLSAIDVLAAAIAVTLKEGNPHFKEMARLLHHEMPAAERARRGITRPWPTAHHHGIQRHRMIRAASEAVRRRFESLTDAFDLFDDGRNQQSDVGSLIAAARKAHADDPTGAKRAARHSALFDVTNSVIHGTLDMIPTTVLAQMGSTFAIDGTFVPTWARGPAGHKSYRKALVAVAKAKAAGLQGEQYDQAVLRGLKTRPTDHVSVEDRVSADPEAGWLNRQNEDGTVEVKGFGFEAHLAICLNPSDKTGTVTFPSLVVGMAFDTPAYDPGPHAVEIADDLQKWARDNGRPPFTDAVFDALYPRLDHDTFHKPLQELGIKPTNRLRKDMLGKAGETYEGLNLVEGTWHCAQMPSNMVDASKNRVAGLLNDDQYDALIEDRRRWQAYEINGSDVLGPDGRPKNRRVACPVSKPGSDFSCPRKNAPTNPAAPPLPVAAIPIGEPLSKACSQRTVTIPHSVGVGHEQALPYMSPEWKALNGRLRSANEGKNGTLKNHKIGIGTKGKRRVNGLGANGLLVACQVAAGNLMSLATFLEETEATAGGVRTRTYSGARDQRAKDKAAGITRPKRSRRRREKTPTDTQTRTASARTAR